MTDPYTLQRFIEAQDGCYELVLRELSAGQKLSHWMWFIFPQVTGLGETATSRKFAISSRDEAKAYWEHPILGARLRACTQLVMGLQGRTAEQVFGYPDYLKFRSCMTLFEAAAPDPTLFRAALLKYFDGVADQRTLAILGHL